LHVDSLPSFHGIDLRALQLVRVIHIYDIPRDSGSPSPIARTPFGVSDGSNINLILPIEEYDEVGKLPQ
jgi:hypothetical protein